MWIMLKLSPVMSSMDMSFQVVVELESPDQVVWHGEPVLKTSPGAGVRGVTSARATSGAARARRAAKACVESMSLDEVKEKFEVLCKGESGDNGRNLRFL
jgi:hypothetical protein